jgi:single-strand DNA-binding protein
MATTLNHVILAGHLTRDPYQRPLRNGGSVCDLRLKVTNRHRNPKTQAWAHEPHYFTVTAYGKLADTCATHLRKGRAIAVNGRLRWHHWEAQDGAKHERVDVIADTVQFLDAAPATLAGNGAAANERTQDCGRTHDAKATTVAAILSDTDDQTAP